MNQRKDKISFGNNYSESESDDIESDEDGASRKERFYQTKGRTKVRQRQENSLGELTKNFVYQIKENSTNDIEINEVVQKLGVKKRRIYDITNVLEGIGYIKKKGKNKIEWLNEELHDETTNDEDEELKLLHLELEMLEYEEMKINQSLIDAKRRFEKVTENEDYTKLGYVTFEDIKTLTDGSDVNLIAIKAPPNTSLDIPDPEQIANIHNEIMKNIEDKMQDYDDGLLQSLSNKYQLFLDSPNGEINVFLVLGNNEDNINNDYSNSIETPLSKSDVNYDSILTGNSNNNINSHFDENLLHKKLSKDNVYTNMDMEEEELSNRVI